MGKSRHLVTFVVTIVTMSKSDAQYLRSRDGIFAISFIEIATPEQHHCVRVLCLQVEELLHHRGQFPVFFGHQVILLFLDIMNNEIHNLVLGMILHIEHHIVVTGIVT